MVLLPTLAALLLAAAVAQQTRTATAGVPAPAASVADFAWLEGEWVGEGFDAALHENYSAAIGGQMPGHFYVAKNGKPTMYEFVMIAEVGNSVEYRVRHFNPDMTAWEDKDSFMRFPLVAVDQDVWYFDGLTIRRTGPDTAEHIVRIKPRDKPVEEAVLRYRRIRR